MTCKACKARQHLFPAKTLSLVPLLGSVRGCASSRKTINQIDPCVRFPGFPRLWEYKSTAVLFVVLIRAKYSYILELYRTGRKYFCSSSSTFYRARPLFLVVRATVMKTTKSACNLVSPVSSELFNTGSTHQYPMTVGHLPDVTEKKGLRLTSKPFPPVHFSAAGPDLVVCYCFTTIGWGCHLLYCCAFMWQYCVILLSFVVYLATQSCILTFLTTKPRFYTEDTSFGSPAFQ